MRAALVLLLLVSCASAPVARIQACPSPEGQAVGCDKGPCHYPEDPGVWLPKQLGDHYVCAIRCCRETQAELSQQGADIPWLWVATAGGVALLGFAFGYVSAPVSK